jgi:Contractile injection system tube protein
MTTIGASRTPKPPATPWTSAQPTALLAAQQEESKTRQSAGAQLSGPELINGTLNFSRTYYLNFDFNPKVIEVKHGVGVKDKHNGQGQDGGQTSQATRIDKLGLPQLNLKETTFYGAETLTKCEQLNAWSFAQALPGQAKSQLPPLKFSWGSFKLRGQPIITATLCNISINYDRFTSSGTPIRASVQITLEPQNLGPGGTNPTSGGLPDRRGHVLASGETLPGIAVDKYDNPSGWRMLAEENQLDDPLRVHPGLVLYVPSLTELADREPQ